MGEDGSGKSDLIAKLWSIPTHRNRSDLIVKKLIKEGGDLNEYEEETFVEDVYDIYRPRGVEDNALVVFDCAGMLPSARLAHHLTHLSCLTRMMIITIKAKNVLESQYEETEILADSDPQSIMDSSSSSSSSHDIGSGSGSSPIDVEEDWETLLRSIPMQFGPTQFYGNSLILLTQMDQILNNKDEEKMSEEDVKRLSEQLVEYVSSKSGVRKDEF